MNFSWVFWLMLVALLGGCSTSPTNPLTSATPGTQASIGGEQGSISPQVTNSLRGDRWRAELEESPMTLEKVHELITSNPDSVLLLEDPEPKSHLSVSTGTKGGSNYDYQYCYSTPCGDLTYCYVTYTRGIWKHSDWSWSGPLGDGGQNYKYRVNKKGGYDYVMHTYGVPMSSNCWPDGDGKG